MRGLLIALTLLAPAAAAAQWARPPAKEGFSYPDCWCSNRGERVEMGELACLRVGGREFTARCAMSQNSPTWRAVGDGCEAVSAAAPEAPPATAPAGPG